MLNESPDCLTDDVFVENLTTAFTGATRIIDARFASDLLPFVCQVGKMMALQNAWLAPEGLIGTHVAR